MDDHNRSLQPTWPRFCCERFALLYSSTSSDSSCSSLATIPFIFIYYFCYDMAYSPLLVVYTLEILPFNIRAKGFAVMVRPSIGLCSNYLTDDCISSEYCCLSDSRFQPICQSLGIGCHRVEIRASPLVLAEDLALTSSFSTLYTVAGSSSSLSSSSPTSLKRADAHSKKPPRFSTAINNHVTSSSLAAKLRPRP